ncbi:hypothetical protein [Okeania sp. SIO2B3]|uniref:hypothetical protein n=1 Tax=Okeania sp. SIO2B3 TaxID=2607784 RepID=UPI0013C070F2|nr:hypothetical protein [Okeania sp. SIO2B3]NET41596.1 hypothetical protein [Okeania sp. SIO2B3]
MQKIQNLYICKHSAVSYQQSAISYQLIILEGEFKIMFGEHSAEKKGNKLTLVSY